MTMRFFTFILCIIFIQFYYAQKSFDRIKLDNYFNTLESNNKFMGSIAVSKNGEIIYKKSVGFSDIENNVKATDISKYRIGSISKSFTAVLIMKAAEDNKLNLNQTIDKWFSKIKNASKISIQHLLNHRSGIHNFTNDKDYLKWNTQPKTENEMLEIITNAGSDFEPDSKSEYSNSNYVLLTFILEKTYSQPYSDLLHEYIVKPIGLNNTSLFHKINPKNNECKSYKYIGTWKEEPETDVTIPLGAGSILSTSNDLVLFADALFGGKLLKSETLEMMKTPNGVYGLGLFQVPFNHHIGYGHTGGIDGFTSVFFHFPNDKLSYALTSNGTNFDNNNISIAVLSAAYGIPYEIPKFISFKLASEDLDKYIGVYASTQISLKISITKDGNTLIAQGTGQPAFPLEATAKDKFKFDQVGAIFEFNPLDNTMVLIQGGAEIKFVKDK